MGLIDTFYREDHRVKDALHKFKRLSSCSFGDVDLWKEECEQSTFIVNDTGNGYRKNLILTLYPCDGQPCACVATWEINFLEKCHKKLYTVTHRIKETIKGHFKANVSLLDNEILIWGKRKNNKNLTEFFKLTLTNAGKRHQSRFVEMEGILYSRSTEEETFQETFEVLLLQ